MKQFLQQSKLYQVQNQDYDKENRTRFNQNRVNPNLSRHCRVQSTLALNLKRTEKSLTSTSFQVLSTHNVQNKNISQNHLNVNELVPVRQIRPQFRLQRCLKGDTDNDTMQIPTQRTKINDLYLQQQESFRASSVNNARNIVESHFQNRVKTDSNCHPPLRSIINAQHMHNQSFHQNVNTTLNLNLENKHRPVALEPFKSVNITGDTPQCVLIYQDEILVYLQKQQVTQNALRSSAFSFQMEVTEKMRSILLDWLVDVHLKFKLQSETLFLTIYLLDQILEKIQIPKLKFQLFGVTAFFIACKYEEVYSVPHVKDLVYACDNSFTKAEILQTEGLILQVLNFDLLHVSSWRFLSLYQETSKLDARNYMQARYFIELAALEYTMVKYPPNLIACSALYLVNKIQKFHPAWSHENQIKSALQEIEIRVCAKDLCTIFQNRDKRVFQSVRNKYSLPKFLEVGKIRIDRKV